MLTRATLALLLGLLLPTAACGRDFSVASGGPEDQAHALCSTDGLRTARAYDPNAKLEVSYASTIGTVARWQETRHGPKGPQPVSPLRGLPEPELMAVCYYEGVFDSFPRPHVPGQVQAPYERMTILVRADGTATFYAAGRKADLRIEAPR